MQFDEIKNDHTSGAEELLVKSGLWLQQEALSFSDSESVAQLTDRFRKMGLDLVHAQPRMAPIINLVNRMLDVCDHVGSSTELISSIAREISLIPDNAQSTKAEIARHLSVLLEPDSVIATYSRSSMVMYALRELVIKIPFRVILMESRPVMEGRIAAQELREAGVPVTLVVDGAMSYAVEQASLVITGADAFDDVHFINKIGTHPLALLCREFQKSLFVLASSSKYLSDINLLPPEQSKPGQEIWPELPNDSGIGIDNHYFENTPLSLVRGVVTERGVWRPGGKVFDSEFRANPWLLEQLSY